MPEAGTNSILAVEIGSVHTRALLFDIVDAEYSLVARVQGKTSIGAPTDDVTVGLKQILQEMAANTGRQFFDQRGMLIKPERSERVGVDYCITTASAGKAIRTVMVGLLADISIKPALRAAAPFYLDAAAEIHLDDGMNDRARLNRIVDSRPDLIFVSGGTDGGAKAAMLDMLKILRQAVMAIPAGVRPTVIYAGNNSLAQMAREMLGQMVEVMIAPNIRPTQQRLTLEPVRVVLTQYYHEFRKTRGSAYQNLSSMSDSGILATARSFETMTSFFARSLGVDALAIDIGSAKSQLSLAAKGQVRTTVRNDIGMGQSASSLFELVGEDAVRLWLPFYPRRGELEQYALKKGLRSASVALDMRERYIDYAFLRAGIRHMLAELRRNSGENLQSIDLSRLGLVIVAGTTITGSGQGALDMLLLADALQIKGVVQVKADRQGAIPALGALAAIEPSAVVQLLQGGLVEHVGSVIRASGQAAAGKRALKLGISLPNGEKITREIAVGDVWHLPLPADKAVDIRIQTGRGIRVGDKGRLRLQLRGGRGGLLFDARLADSLEDESITERAVNMLRWFAAVTGESQPVMIPESWLAAPDNEGEENKA